MRETCLSLWRPELCPARQWTPHGSPPGPKSGNNFEAGRRLQFWPTSVWQKQCLPQTLLYKIEGNNHSGELTLKPLWRILEYIYKLSKVLLSVISWFIYFFFQLCCSSRLYRRFQNHRIVTSPGCVGICPKSICLESELPTVTQNDFLQILLQLQACLCPFRAPWGLRWSFQLCNGVRNSQWRLGF